MGDSQFNTLVFSSAYVILVVVLWQCIWLKLLKLPVPVAFGSSCVEWSMLLRGRPAVKMVETTRQLNVEARQKRGVAL